MTADAGMPASHPGDAEAGQAGIDELSKWWKGRVLAEIDATVPKAIEYGSHDLIEMGRTLAYVMKRDGISDEEAAELGIWFYQLGKMGRWTNAIRNQTRVSDDTLLDIGVYAKMAQRVRDAGGWPGVDLGPQKETK